MFYRIDLHGCTQVEAKIQLDKKIKEIKGKGELTVIHGYSSNILQNYVRKTYKNKRVKRKILSMNPGETTYVIE